MLCSDCGRPVTECTDSETVYTPFRRVCYPTMEREAADALYARLHEKQPYHDGTFTSWAEHRSASHPYHFHDGVKIGVAESDLTPHDMFTTEQNASPVPPDDED